MPVDGQPHWESEIAAVPTALAACGYSDLAAAFLPSGVCAQSWSAVVASLDDPLRAVAQLLLLGDLVPTERLPGDVMKVLPALQRSGVCTVQDGSAYLGGLSLFRVQGLWLLAQPPQVAPTLYFGDDSLALAARLDAGPGRCLDLCAGPGVQSLILAARGRDVVAVEINPVAAAVCAVNVAMNGLTDRISVRCGDLYDAVGGGVFDLVCANPPLLPIPEGMEYPFVGDGGPDGLAVTWQILSGLADRLSEVGHAQLIGMTLSDGFLPLRFGELSEWIQQNGFDMRLSAMAHLSTALDSWWVQGVGASTAAHSGPTSATEIDRSRRRLSAGYAALGAEYVCTYFMRVTRGTGKMRYLDLSPGPGEGGLWYR